MAPTQPILNGSAISALSVQLTWQRPIGDVANYTIMYHPVNQPSVDSRNTTIPESGTLTTTIGNLSPNTTYQFTMQAAGQYGTSLPSDPISITTLLQSGKCIGSKDILHIKNHPSFNMHGFCAYKITPLCKGKKFELYM